MSKPRSMHNGSNKSQQRVASKRQISNFADSLISSSRLDNMLLSQKNIDFNNLP